MIKQPRNFAAWDLKCLFTFMHFQHLPPLPSKIVDFCFGGADLLDTIDWRANPFQSIST